MKTAFSSIVITPPLGVPLAGNARADARARGTHDDLRANYAYLDTENGGAYLLVGLDLIGIAQAEADAIKQRIEKSCGLPPERVTIAATHTHSGPNTMNIFPELMSDEERAACDSYVQWLVDAVADAVPPLVASAEEGLFGVGRDVVEGFSYCRRIVLKNGDFKMVFEDYDPDDIDYIAGVNGNPVMNVWVFATPAEQVKGLVVNFTSHPAVVCGEGLLYCRDYIDALTCGLQKRYGKDVVVVYVNGAQGDLVAADPYKPFITGFEEAQRVGEGLCRGAEAIVDRVLMERAFTSAPVLKTVTRTATLPLRTITEAEQQKAQQVLKAGDSGKVQLHGLDPKVEANSVLALAALPQTEESTVIQAVMLDEFLAVTFPGEVFSHFAREVVRHSKVKNTTVFGLANAMIGYIPTREAFGQGGYEIKPSLSSSRFAPEAGDMLADACKALVDEICGGAS